MGMKKSVIAIPRVNALPRRSNSLKAFLLTSIQYPDI
jgi:hypothetical protein